MELSCHRRNFLSVFGSMHFTKAKYVESGRISSKELEETALTNPQIRVPSYDIFPSTVRAEFGPRQWVIVQLVANSQALLLLKVRLWLATAPVWPSAQ